MEYFANSLQHLLAELERVDLLLRTQVTHSRHVVAEDERFRGLYVSEQEVDELLQRPLGRPSWLTDDPATKARLTSALAALETRSKRLKAESLRRGVDLRLEHLRQQFDLDRVDVDVLLICMGVELDLRYERLYAYLQDDVTRKRPSVDLVQGLLGPALQDRFALLRRFGGDAQLMRHRLLVLTQDPAVADPPLIARFLKVDSRIASYLLGSDALDDRIRPFTEWVEPSRELHQLLLEPHTKERLDNLAHRYDLAAGVVVHLLGPYGAGKRETAEALCHSIGQRLLVVDLERLLAEGSERFEESLELIQREAMLRRSALLWNSFDSLLEDKQRALLNAFSAELARHQGLQLLGGERSWFPGASLRDIPIIRLELARPEVNRREQVWHESLNGRSRTRCSLDLGPLASRFRLTGGQIRDAAATARNLARWRDGDQAAITMDDLYEACRLHSSQRLTSLARKITPKYRWDDIILPPERLRQLREICNHIKYRDQVYTYWGFGPKLAYGKGLSVLFSGPSGTGKTMAADIIAGELGLDLFKIDLSTVVSKYIGETEKNLSNIFNEAETSNAVLFFDEADALFGKRSEVKDSHDRYANIETGYLLQRMEEYEGVAILATNLRKNLDEAFVRRLHFTVEFPFPNALDRRRIWEGIWPKSMQRSRSVDLELMASKFEISGGNIRNIAVGAAFLAADEGVHELSMEHLLRATQREYQKMGKVITADFGQAVRRASDPFLDHH